MNRSALHCSSKYWRRWLCALTNKRWNSVQVIEQIKQNFDKNHELSAEESRIIEKTAAEYDVFTRLKGYQRHKFLLTELLNRVDAVPPSFLIAAAAMETNWGTSRIVKEGNSLYKQLVWHSDKRPETTGRNRRRHLPHSDFSLNI